jgi:DNA-binding NtrC family response regulator
MTDGDRPTAMGMTMPQASSTIVAVPRLRFSVEREGGKAVERTFEIDGERIRVGSHPSNELVLDDRLVSRFHCTLMLQKAAWRITDTESLNGTFVAGVRIRDAVLPSGECELRLGESKLRVAPRQAATVAKISQATHFGELHGTSLAMRRVFEVLERVSTSDATVLIEGESGTGKELVAHEIVRRGARARQPFLTIDCSAISPGLIESELFGHVRGAFTGAERARVGAFEGAHGGTILLDEIGEMPLEMQPKLLRALEAREIRRAGENEARKVDVRVIAATNRNLEREVNRGRFREDLYFRLSVISVRLPPLRERLEDLTVLVRAFLERMDELRSERLFTPAVYDELARHEWPGNVRELRNYVERAIVLEDPIGPSSPSTRQVEPEAGEEAGHASIEEPFKLGKERVIAEFERAYLERLIAWAGGNVSKAARKARIDRMYLHRLLERHAMRRESQSDDE